MKRFVVIGLGNFGSSAAEALHAQGHEVIAVDPREEVVDRIAPHVSRAAVADGRSIDALERVGARGADAGVVGTGDDITASILATMALRDLGWTGFIQIVVFFAILVTGYIYVWRKGVLDWGHEG